MTAPQDNLDSFIQSWAARARARFSPMGQSLKVRVFRWWFGSQVLSASGTMTQAVALSWLVLRLTNSAILLSLVSAFSFAPYLVGGALAGSLVDRFDRRHILVATQSAFCALGLAFATLDAAGLAPVWVIFVYALATGMIATVDSPARQVFVLDLVGTERAANAVSLNEVVINSSRVLGPAVGGALLVTVGPDACFFFNALSYLPPLAVMLVLMHRRGWAPAAPSGSEHSPGHVRQGLAYAWRHPAIRSCLWFAVAGGMLFNMGTTLPLVTTRAFHAGAGDYGSLLAAFGVGALFGAALAGSVTWPSGRSVRALVLATGIEVCLAAAAPWIGLLYVGLVGAGLLSIWFISLANALVQLRSQPEFRGRVMGVWSMALPGMGPVTSLMVGGVATWGGGGLGAREAFGLSGVALVVSALLGWRSLADRGNGGGVAPAIAPDPDVPTGVGGMALPARREVPELGVPGEDERGRGLDGPHDEEGIGLLESPRRA